MKDALGHGSNPRGEHSGKIDQLGETRYHQTKRAYWEAAQKTGYLDPKSYSTGMIWTSTHPAEYYSKQYGARFALDEPDDVELAITTKPKNYRPTPGNEGGGSADRVTRVKIPIKNIREVPQKLPSLAEYRKANR